MADMIPVERVNLKNDPTKKRALITGVTGQDGFYLAQLLLDKGYEVHGILRTYSTLDSILRDRLTSISLIDLEKPAHLEDVVRKVRPHEIYHLAATHFSSEGKDNIYTGLEKFLSVNVLAPNSALEVMRRELRETRLFYAASCHIFGAPDTSFQRELTPQKPIMPYGISKAAGFNLCKYFRENHNLYVSSGILYNHESPRRGENFVTTIIAKSAAKASLGATKPLYLRNLDSIVDWGSAQDYVKAMWLSLQQPKSDDYVIASGEPRTVRDFAREAYQCVGLCAGDFVFQKAGKETLDQTPYVGDSTRIRKICNWTPSISFKELVSTMVYTHLEKLKKALK